MIGLCRRSRADKGTGTRKGTATPGCTWVWFIPGRTEAAGAGAQPGSRGGREESGQKRDMEEKALWLHGCSGIGRPEGRKTVVSKAGENGKA